MTPKLPPDLMAGRLSRLGRSRFFSFGTALAIYGGRYGTNNVGLRKNGAGLREEQGLD